MTSSPFAAYQAVTLSKPLGDADLGFFLTPDTTEIAAAGRSRKCSRLRLQLVGDSPSLATALVL